MSYEEFIKKLNFIKNINIETNDIELKKSLEKLLNKEIDSICKKYYE